MVENEKRIIIGSEIVWDLGHVPFDAKHHFKDYDFYFNGSDKETYQLFWIDENKIEIKAYFPLQKNGRKLNETTTIHLSVRINDMEVFFSKHFGRHSEWRVAKEYEILPRPLSVDLSFEQPDKVVMIVQGELGETTYEDGNKISQRFSIPYSFSKPQNCIDDKILAQDKTRYTLSTKTENPNIEEAEEEAQQPDSSAVPFTVNETFRMFYIDKKAYHSLDFVAHQHEDVYGITTEDWYTYVDLEVETPPFYDVRQKIIAMEIEEIKHEESSILRIRDPEFSLFSNTVSFDNGNFTVNREEKLFTIKNTKPNIVIEGVNIVSPLKRKQIKFVFHKKHIIKSIKTVPSTVTTERKDNTVIFSGEGVENLKYEIEYTILPYKTYKKEKDDLPVATVKLKQENSLIYLKSDTKSYTDIYVNDMRLTENIVIEQKERPIYPYVLYHEVDNLTIKNVGENDATFEFIIKNKRLEIDQTLVYKIQSGSAQKLYFEFE
ncbi:MAG: hypothetical protein P8H25_05915 [Flavobacteriaceae bacterium]|nr:hypothetical protein [Flavobacteriaceae bacterium]